MKLYNLTEADMEEVLKLAFWAAADPDTPYHDDDFAERIMGERDAQELAK